MPPRASAVAAASTYNMPAPVGGLNARDAYTDMKPEDAVGLTNVFPEASYCKVRGGFTSSVTGMSNPVRSLLVWRGDTDKIFGGAGTSIWACSVPGVASSVVTGLTNVDFQWTNIRNDGGQFLIYVNGADPMGAYDGTDWTIPTISGGVDSSTFNNVCLFKERLWFFQASSLDAYYLDLQAIEGVATLFPLGAVFRRGGYVTNCGTFSRDAGEGPDDFFVIITNQGEVAIYQGTDPASDQTWQLVGIFDIGQTMGRRDTVRINGDLAIITHDGVVSAQALLQFDRASIQKAAITGKIQTLFSQYAQLYQGLFGWQPCVYPESRFLIINVPKATNSLQIQLVMNTITGQWCQFQGMNAGCWAMANELLYFGGNDGVMYEAETGYFDLGQPIAWDVQTSWQMVGGATNKYFTMVKPTMLTGGNVAYGVTIDVDFKSQMLVPYVAGSAQVGTVWDWTWPSTWLAALALDAQWRSVGAIGTWASVHMTGTVNGSALQINSFEVLMQKGGPL